MSVFLLSDVTELDEVLIAVKVGRSKKISMEIIVPRSYLLW